MNLNSKATNMCTISLGETLIKINFMYLLKLTMMIRMITNNVILKHMIINDI